MLRPYFCNQKNWENFKAEILSWVGTPYRHLQKAKGYGADCTMFAGQCFVNVGVLDKLTYEYYSKDWHIHTDDPLVENSIHLNLNENLIDKKMVFKKIFNAHDHYVRGDCVLMGLAKPHISNHCSILLDDGEKMIHCINNAGVEVTHYVKWWKRHTRYKIRLFEEV